HPIGGDQPGILFTGDTLFVNGCGRIFENDTKTMLNSLLKLAALPDDTLVYCGHNYTVENYEFALSLEPDNEALRKRLEQVRQAKQEVPSTISQEKQTNPFLRADTSEIKAALDMSTAKTEDVFAELRHRKDVF
ncbi:MAG: hydroxyacylglutathione hydrolase C-terminal domain-containing protein, partial [Planctomycetota bacterium]